MKSFFALIVALFLLFGVVFSISAFLGRDLLLNILSFDSSSDEFANKKVISRFVVISDTHSDSETTNKAVSLAKELGAAYIVHTGDWTTVGTLDELNDQKKIFDEIKLPYWGVMGDHDRWQSRERNFESVFGARYESFEKNGILHILVDASDLNNGLGEEQLDWLSTSVGRYQNRPKIIFMHLPIYHPTSERTIADKGGQSQSRTEQVKRFLEIIKDKNVIAIFSGDHHLSSSYTEPKTSVRIFISGAATKDRNLQTPRFSLVEVYEDFTIKVKDEVVR